MRRVILLLFSFFPLVFYGQVIHFDLDKPKNGNSMRFHWYEAQMNGGLSFTEDRFNNGCRALSFDGTGYLVVKNSESLNLQNFTLAVWLKTTKQWFPLICKGSNMIEGDDSPAYRVELTSNTSSYNFLSTRLIGTVNQNFPQNTWFHLAVVVKRNGRMTIYINGNKTYQYDVDAPIFHNNEPLEIGRDVPGMIDYFQGIMDDFRLYDYSLSDKEIEKIYRESPAKMGDACADIPPPAPVPNPVDLTDLTPKTPQNPSDDFYVDLTGLAPDNQNDNDWQKTTTKKPDPTTKTNEQKPEDIFIDLTGLTPATQNDNDWQKTTTKKPNPTTKTNEQKPEDIFIDLTGLTPEKADTTDVVMIDSIAVRVGEKVILKNIQFYQSKAKVLPSSLPTLEKLYETMKKYPTMEIELHGHTDNVGDENKNLQLSEERVKAIKKYLVDKKIEPHRIQTKYFGGSKPIADNSSEYTRRLNRRVEIVILKK